MTEGQQKQLEILLGNWKEAAAGENGETECANIAKKIRKTLTNPWGEVDPWDEEVARAAALVESDRAAALEVLQKASGARRALPVSQIRGDRPEALLSAKDQEGAVLTIGNVCLLAGEGGIAKSSLCVGVALGLAALPDGESGDVSGGLFEGKGGPVLMATWEDEPSVTAWQVRELAMQRKTPQDRVDRVHILGMGGRPLFGPKEGSSYNFRPERLDGWNDLWSEARRIRPRLIVVDPALEAYVGEANAVAPVREFLGALAREAGKLRAGVLLVVHSNKAARKPNQPENKTKDKKKPDPFDPGQVAGSTAWTDGVRGVLAMTWTEEPGERVLAVAKANYGPARIKCHLEPCRHESNAIVGFQTVDEWRDEASSTTPTGKAAGAAAPREYTEEELGL